MIFDTDFETYMESIFPRQPRVNIQLPINRSSTSSTNSNKQQVQPQQTDRMTSNRKIETYISTMLHPTDNRPKFRPRTCNQGVQTESVSTSTETQHVHDDQTTSDANSSCDSSSIIIERKVIGIKDHIMRGKRTGVRFMVKLEQVPGNVLKRAEYIIKMDGGRECLKAYLNNIRQYNSNRYTRLINSHPNMLNYL